MTHIWTAPILGTSVGETSKKAKTEDPSEKVSVLKELAPDEALEELVLSESGLEESKREEDEVTTQRRDKKLSQGNLETGAEEIQLVIDLADWVSKKREGRGPP